MSNFLPNIIAGGIATVFVSGLIYLCYRENKKETKENKEFLDALTDEELEKFYKDSEKNIHLFHYDSVDSHFYQQLKEEYKNRILKND